MKKHICIIFCWFTVHTSYAQVANWAPLSTGLNGEPTCMIVFNNKLIVGGSFTSAGGNLANNIAAWDGANWSVLGSGLKGNATAASIGCSGFGYIGGYVASLVIFNNELYAGGTFTNAGGSPCKNIAKWNGTSWSSVGGGVGPNQVLGVVHSLKVYNNELYVGGRIDSAGNVKVKNIAKWNGSNWSNVSGGTNLPIYAKVRAMDTLNNKLYIAGVFDTIGVTPANNIAAWDGSNWAALGAGFNFTLGTSVYGVTFLSTYNNMLYAGNPNTGISKWDGTNWIAVGGGVSMSGSNGGNLAYCATKYSNDLIVGGTFNNAGLLTYPQSIAKWNDNVWSHVGIPLVSGTDSYSGFNSLCVRALAVYNNELYAGGSFLKEFLQNANLNRIARFLNLVGINDIAMPQNQVSVFPNPSTNQFNFNGLIGENTIQIMDITGRILFAEKTSSENHSINLNASQGMYFYKISDKQNRIQQGKLILE